MIKILVIGKNGYVSTCFQNYIKRFSHIRADAVSVRDGKWKGMDFGAYNAVFNATGLAHNDARMGTDEQFMALNVTLPYELAKKAKADGVGIFVNMGSMIIYGDMQPVGSKDRVSLETVPKPANIYGRSKLLGEQKIMELNDDSFRVSSIRSSLVYGETAPDNFGKMVDYALKLPFFPYVKNERSMIYCDNLCELVRLIIENKSSGIFFPQQEEYICTARLMKDIAAAAGHRLILVKGFGWLIRLGAKPVKYLNKIYGNHMYEPEISEHFGGAYRVVSYRESADIIGKARKS